MTDRPLPPHGSYARANGSPRYRKPCNCPPCTQTRNRRKKQYRIDSGRGNSARIDERTEVRRLESRHFELEVKSRRREQPR